MFEEFDKPSVLTKAERVRLAELMNKPVMTEAERLEVRTLIAKVDVPSKSVVRRLSVQIGGAK
jgi:hypothetical protein